METTPQGVPLQKGMEITGLDKTGFFYYVNAEQIKRIKIDDGKSPTLYDYQDVLSVRDKRLKRLSEQKPKKTRLLTPLYPAVFCKVTPEDMTELAPVIEAIFKTHPDVERWISWIRKNPDIGYMLRSENRIVGVGFVVPHSESKILDIFSKELTPPTLIEEVLAYQPGVSTCVYVRTIGVLGPEQDTRINLRQSRHWASILIRNLINVLVDLGSKGVIIEKIYGRSDSPEGARLMEGMGFTHLRTTTSHQNYVIDVRTSGIEMVLDYEQSLLAWFQRQAGE